MIRLENYDERYLEKSWEWLNDPEIKALTHTPDFTKKQQQTWFNNLGENPNYKIWGVSFNSTPIGVFGIKNIDQEEKKGEYWGYIGEKDYWGKGLGKESFKQVLDLAKDKLELKKVYLKVLKTNVVAINLYKKFNFESVGRENDMIIMEKIL